MKRPAAASLFRGLPLPSLLCFASCLFLPALPGLSKGQATGLSNVPGDAPLVHALSRPRVRPQIRPRACLFLGLIPGLILSLLLVLLAFAAAPPQAAAASRHARNIAGDQAGSQTDNHGDNQAGAHAAASPKAPKEAPTEAVVVLARLSHDPEAFTQGLVLHQGALFESTGLYGQSSLRRLDPSTGRVLARQPLPRKLFGEGLAACDTKPRRLVQLTWREGVIRSYDPASLRLVAEHSLRGEGWGLACRGAELTVSDGTDTLRFLKAQTLAETGEARRVYDGARPVVRLNELEWVNGWLVANIWGEDRLAVIRPDAGPGVWRVALWLDLSPLRRELANGAETANRAETANGIAFDPAAQGGRGALYLTGKRWNTLFVAALPALMRQPPQGGAARATGRE